MTISIGNGPAVVLYFFEFPFVFQSISLLPCGVRCCYHLSITNRETESQRFSVLRKVSLKSCTSKRKCLSGQQKSHKGVSVPMSHNKPRGQNSPALVWTKSAMMLEMTLISLQTWSRQLKLFIRQAKRPEKRQAVPLSSCV